MIKKRKYKAFTTWSLTIRYLGSDKYIIRHFNYSAHQAVVRSPSAESYTDIITVIYEGEHLGVVDWQDFLENWEIVDRRVLIEKTDCFI